MARRFSREDICELSGATAEELAEFEARKLLVPTVPRLAFWVTGTPYYTEGQIEVLRWLVKARRAQQRAVKSTRRLG